MTFIISLIFSIIIIFFLSLFYKEEAFFWLEKLRIKRKKKKFEKESKTEKGQEKPIEKYCGFRDFSSEGGQICTLFEHEDGSEYFVSEEICRQCLVWERYEEWLDSDKKKDFSVTLAHTMSGSEPMVVETDKLNPQMESGLKFKDFVVKRRRVPWAGKAAIAVLTLVTYLMVYFSGVFTNPVVKAMPDIWYFYDTGTDAHTNSWNMYTTDPASFSDQTSQCDSQAVADSGKYCTIGPGIYSTTYLDSNEQPTWFGWQTSKNDLLNGTIPAGTWTIYAKYDYIDSGDCLYASNAIQYKIWQDPGDWVWADPIQDWTQVCAVTAGTNTCSDAISLGAVTLTDELIHIEFRHYVSYKSCSDAPNNQLDFWVDDGVGRIDTPTYEPIPENSIFLAAVVPFLPAIVKKFKLKDYFKKK